MKKKPIWIKKNNKRFFLSHLNYKMIQCAKSRKKRVSASVSVTVSIRIRKICHQETETETETETGHWDYGDGRLLALPEQHESSKQTYDAMIYKREIR